GVAEPEQAGDLVEGLPGRVVEGVAEVLDRVAHQVADGEERGVAAGDDQHDAALGQRAVLEGVGGGVPGQVVHSVQRLPQRPGDRLRSGEAHVHGGGQTGSGGDGDVRDVGQVHAR